jgi:hypothetical protein
MDLNQTQPNPGQEEAQAESLEKTNTAPAAPAEESPKKPRGKAAGGGNNNLYVFAALKQPQSFRLADGRVMTINGFPVSSLRQPGGGFFAGGKYGVTQVPAGQWEQVMKIYGQMKIFKSGLIFSAPSLERGQDMARERGSLRHGFEPIDPNSSRAKTQPNSRD